MNIGTLQAWITANTTNFDQGMARAQAAMTGFGKNSASTLASTAQKFRTFGYLSSTALTLPIVMAGKAVLKMASDYEFSMQKIVGLTNQTQAAVDDWGKSIMKLGPEIGKGPKELADAMYFIASAAFSGKRGMDVLAMSAKAAAAGLGETKQISMFVTSALNAYAGTGLTAAAATDILIAAVREGKTEAESFTSSIGQVIPMAAELGVSLDQVAGGMAVITLTGSTASQAATYLKGVFNSLLKATMHGEKALATMGSSYQQLRKILREQGVVAVMQELRDMSEQYGETLASEVFPNIRALTGFLSIAGKNFEYNKEAMNRVKNSAGSLDNAWKAVADTIQVRMKSAMAQINVSMISLGEAVAVVFIPILNKLATVIGNVTTWFNGLSEEGKKWRVTSLLILAAAGPLSLLFSLLLYAINGLKLAFVWLATGGLVAVKTFGLWALGLFDVAKASAATIVATNGVTIATAEAVAAERVLAAAKLKTAEAILVATAANLASKPANDAVTLAVAEQAVAEQALTVAKGQVVVATNAATAASTREAAVIGRVSMLKKISIALNTALAWTYGKWRTGALLALGAENLAVTVLKAKKASLAATITLTKAQELLTWNNTSATYASTVATNAENVTKAKAVILQQAYMAKLDAGKSTRQSILTIQAAELAYNEAYIVSQRARITADILAIKVGIQTRRVREMAVVVAGFENIAMVTSTSIQNGATVGKIRWTAALKASVAWQWLSTLATSAGSVATAVWAGISNTAYVVTALLGKAIKQTTIWTLAQAAASKIASAATATWSVVTMAFQKVMKSAFMLTAAPIAVAAGITAAVAAAVVGIVLLISYLTKAKTAKKELEKIDKEQLEASQETSAQIGKESAELEILVMALKANNVPMAVRAKLVQEFNDKYGEYLGYLIDETTGVAGLTKAYETLVPLIKSRLALEGAIAYAGTASANKAKTETEILSLKQEQIKLLKEEDIFLKKHPNEKTPTTFNENRNLHVYKSYSTEADFERRKRLIEITKQLIPLEEKLPLLVKNYAASVDNVTNQQIESNKVLEENRLKLEEKAIADKKVLDSVNNMTDGERKSYEIKEKIIKRIEEEIKAEKDNIKTKEDALNKIYASKPMVSMGDDYKFWKDENDKIEAAKKVADNKEKEVEKLKGEQLAVINSEWSDKQVKTREKLVQKLSQTAIAAYDKSLVDLKVFEEEKKQILKEKETADKAVSGFKEKQKLFPVEYTTPEMVMAGNELVSAANKVQYRLNEVNNRIKTSTAITASLSGEALKTEYEEVLGYIERLEEKIKDKKDRLSKLLSKGEVLGEAGTKLKSEIEADEYKLKQAQLNSKDLIEEQVKRNKTLQMVEEIAVRRRQYTTDVEEAKLFDIKIKWYDKETEAIEKTLIGNQEKIDYADARKAERESMVVEQTIKAKETATKKYMDQMDIQYEMERMKADQLARLSISDDTKREQQIEQNRINAEKKRLDNRWFSVLFTGKQDPTLLKDTYQWQIDEYNNSDKGRAVFQQQMHDKANKLESESGQLAQLTEDAKTISTLEATRRRRDILIAFWAFEEEGEGRNTIRLEDMSREELNRVIKDLDERVKAAQAANNLETANAKTAAELQTAIQLKAKALTTKATDDASKKLEDFNTAARQMVESLITDIAIGLGEGIGNALSGKDFGFDEILKTFGNFVKQMGALFIAYGAALEAFNSKHPIAMIAAGIALVAIGQVITNKADSMTETATGSNQTKAYAGLPSFAEGGFIRQPTVAVVGDAKDGKGEWVLNSKQMEGLKKGDEKDLDFLMKRSLSTFKNIPSFATGGIVKEPTVAMVGDNKNAKNDPEVISPVSKLIDIFKKTFEMPLTSISQTFAASSVLVSDKNAKDSIVPISPFKGKDTMVIPISVYKTKNEFEKDTTIAPKEKPVSENKSNSTPNLELASIKNNIKILSEAVYAATIPYFGSAEVGKKLQNLEEMANGGLLTGPQLVLAGEYAGARNNPEVIAPLSKLQMMLDNRGGGGVLTAVVSGKALKFVLDQENKFLHRT